MSNREKRLVLVADDNAETCTLISAILQRDFDVELAHDGSDALEKLRTRNYAAVLLDLRMPYTDGFGVLDDLQTTRPELLARILVVTASLSAHEQKRIRDYPIAGLIAKPFDVEHLHAAVKRCAGNGDAPLGSLLSGSMLFLLADLLKQRLM